MDRRRRAARNMDRNRGPLYGLHERKSRRQTDRRRIRGSARSDPPPGSDAVHAAFPICRQGGAQDERRRISTVRSPRRKSWRISPRSCTSPCAAPASAFRVESQNVQKLPQIKKQTGKKFGTHVIEDSKEGWCDALTLGLKTWFDGKDIDFDYSAAPSRRRAAEDDGRQEFRPGTVALTPYFSRGEDTRQAGQATFEYRCP